ncbi:RNA polymerase sigma factor [Ktedonobacter robiniae]|uniref:RNA polymerase sigma24 factor n=1 Tax=Ktedonobacter robiniae TaxID=2778365 RepID=A0ABQ3V2H1_9CHLR|nr:RNA polymerase sigma factor [Ktedonobacter robiniae]GHO59361.1 RNA polymerase sigma24 factor [Ktedonobacter robiniae]
MQPLDTDELQNVGKSMLYERFAEPLLAYVCQQVSNRQDAEDLLLEVFLAALQNTSLARFTAPRQLAWLRRVARNKVIDHYRREALFIIHPLEQAQETEDQSLTPEQQVEEQEKWTWLLQAIEHLSPVQRELVRLRYVQELRLTQIAALMGKPEGSVRTMLSRTLRRLKTFYEQNERRENRE